MSQDNRPQTPAPRRDVTAVALGAVLALAGCSSSANPAPATLCGTTNGSPYIGLYPATVSGRTATVDGVVIVTPGSTLTGIDWDWGDGTTATGCVYFPESHTYAQPGEHTVTVTATGTNGFRMQTREQVSVE